MYWRCELIELSLGSPRRRLLGFRAHAKNRTATYSIPVLEDLGYASKSCSDIGLTAQPEVASGMLEGREDIDFVH
jgi:hypothetical protein